MKSPEEFTLPQAGIETEAENEITSKSPEVEIAKVSNEQLERYADSAELCVTQQAAEIVPRGEKRIDKSAQSMNISPEMLQAIREEQGLGAQLQEIQTEADQLANKAKLDIKTATQEPRQETTDTTEVDEALKRQELKNKEQTNLNEAKNDVALTEKAKADFGKIFDDNQDSREAARVLLEKISLVLDDLAKNGFLEEEKIERIKKELKECSSAENKEEFIERALSATWPVADLGKSNPQLFEKIRRSAFVREGGFIPVNEILSYGVYEGIMHIHLAPAEQMGTSEKLFNLKDGLKGLAEVVKKDESVKIITATSWIVTEHPKLLERFGFIVEGEIDEETKKKYFSDETRVVSRAYMTREDFLRKYSE